MYVWGEKEGELNVYSMQIKLSFAAATKLVEFPNWFMLITDPALC